MSMKNSNDTIWNRTSDLPVCSSHKASNIFSSHQWINRPVDADMHFVPRFVGGSADSCETLVFYVMEKSFFHIH
jgi:hypothetical protein